MSDGLLSIKDKRKPTSEKSSNLNQEPYNMTYKSKKYNPYKYVSPSLVNSSPVSSFSILRNFVRLYSIFLCKKNDHLIAHTTKQHLKKYDKHLKKFNASKALDSALDVILFHNLN